MKTTDLTGVYIVYPDGGIPKCCQIQNGKIMTCVNETLHETFKASGDYRQHLTALCLEEDLPLADEDEQEAVCALLEIDPETHVVCRPWVESREISIFRNNVWAGTGTLTDDGEIVDCSAVFGVDQDESDEIYNDIAEAVCDGKKVLVRGTDEYAWTVKAKRS